MRYDESRQLHFERGDRVWCWFDSFGPPVKGTVLHELPPHQNYDDRYGVFLDHVCPSEGERLVTRVGWLLWSVFAPEMVQAYPLDALAEASRAI